MILPFSHSFCRSPSPQIKRTTAKARRAHGGHRAEHFYFILSAYKKYFSQISSLSKWRSRTRAQSVAWNFIFCGVGGEVSPYASISAAKKEGTFGVCATAHSRAAAAYGVAIAAASKKKKMARLFAATPSNGGAPPVTPPDFMQTPHLEKTAIYLFTKEREIDRSHAFYASAKFCEGAE